MENPIQLSYRMTTNLQIQRCLLSVCEYKLSPLQIACWLKEDLWVKYLLYHKYIQSSDTKNKLETCLKFPNFLITTNQYSKIHQQIENIEHILNNNCNYLPDERKINSKINKINNKMNNKINNKMNNIYPFLLPPDIEKIMKLTYSTPLFERLNLPEIYQDKIRNYYLNYLIHQKYTGKFSYYNIFDDSSNFPRFDKRIII